MSRLRVAANGQVTFRQALSWRLGVQPAETPTVHNQSVALVSGFFRHAPTEAWNFPVGRRDQRHRGSWLGPKRMRITRLPSAPG